MKAKLTSKGRITVPIAIRRRLGLKAGDVLLFDESAPFLKAVKTFSRAEMMRTIGAGRSDGLQRTSAEWMEELRGPVEIEP